MKNKDERVNAQTRDKKMAWELFSRLQGDISMAFMEGYFINTGITPEEITEKDLAFVRNLLNRINHAVIESIRIMGHPSASVNNAKSMMLDTVIMDYLHKNIYPLLIKLRNNDMGEDKIAPMDKVREVYTFLSQITSQVCYKGYLLKKPTE